MSLIEEEMKRKDYRKIVDFDMHLGDCSLDFTNEFVGFGEKEFAEKTLKQKKDD